MLLPHGILGFIWKMCSCPLALLISFEKRALTAGCFWSHLKNVLLPPGASDWKTCSYRLPLLISFEKRAFATCCFWFHLKYMLLPPIAVLGGCFYFLSNRHCFFEIFLTLIYFLVNVWSSLAYCHNLSLSFC